MSKPKNNFKNIALTVLFVIVLNFAGHFVFHRFDLTADKRYTLSETSLTIVNEVKEPLYIDVFLEGEFPGEFKKLQTETQQLLEEFKAQNSNVIFQFVNPLEEEEQRENTIQSFLERGLTPVNVTVNDKGQQTQEVVFPWAVATCGDRSVKVPLLKNMMGASTAEKVVSSVQHLEYAFANAINTVAKEKQKKVIILNGNGELEDRYIADFIKSVRENYFIAPFTLDSVPTNPTGTLEHIKKYDLAVIAKPTEAFSDAEKQVLDQFIMNGGKTLWLVDQVAMEMDSLYNETGANLAFPRDLGLNDMFFKYGIRMKPDLIFDLQNTPIALATGEQGSATQYTQYPWFYAPLIYPTSKNPIVTNLDGIKFDFAGPIELLGNDIKKTVLLQSSQVSRLVGTPTEVNLNIVSLRPEQKEFAGKGNYPVAVLLEGNFHSMYENRILPFKEANFQKTGKTNKMIVVSDGDIIKNQFDKNGTPLELGFDKWTNNLYANKEFMMNCVNYLMDDSGLINIRSKEVNLPMLDKQKVYDNYTNSQIVTVAMPIVILLLFGIAFTLLRKRKYSR
ncbi:MAG: gliding motility-associated ABC transporter substrate-binding protein GldG [Flavobacterium sp.]|jgi:gliding-associated putative ABC transporter substrate-binding component GldG|uniref:Gliding motility-associated ABC transporter substrate-binding protein GldG n=1 Tax=Flavobacterium cheonhonense TaxID=706185 RepID=A0ABP7TIJ5_9FLAO|nr:MULTISPECIES: gliding motility-associated ABC transporter substrate-binding protein GldG [Flavobacterium]MBA4135369.1 gliding motility-associated ABC transporter substrate-binding protein GldG [Flavobacterium sp.]PJE41724.1 MAG: gliding motility-associated ABC transporter substrate-binding protein GldG [Flavobacterium sp.] [Flavobacterium sp. FEMGT703F]